MPDDCVCSGQDALQGKGVRCRGREPCIEELLSLVVVWSFQVSLVVALLFMDARYARQRFLEQVLVWSELGTVSTGSPHHHLSVCCRMCRWGLLCKDVMLNVRVGGRCMRKALSMSGGGVKCDACVARGFRLVMPAGVRHVLVACLE